MIYTIWQNLEYRLLKRLSHNRSQKNNMQVSFLSEQDKYSSAKSEEFLKYIDPYVNYRDKSILDIGCGTGDLSITLSKLGAKRVVGIDIDEERVLAAQRKAISECVENTVSFKCVDFTKDYHPDNLFDIVFSQDAFEHIPEPLSCLNKVHHCLVPEGLFATIFGPLWLSPYGAHMFGFTSVPWVHLLFSENTVLRVRREYFRPDEPAHRYEDIRGHLNRMTVRKFKHYTAEAGFIIQAFRLNPNQDQGKYKLANTLVNTFPLLQEPGSLALLAVLRKSA